jgi:hypothetical protein
MTKTVIWKLRREGFHVPRHIERFLLDEYENDYFPHGWTNVSDAYAEIKGIVDAYAHTRPSEFLGHKYEIILGKFNDLKEDYFDLLYENRKLWEGVPDIDDDDPF